MKRRPKGRRYRNLYTAGSVIYYQRRVSGRHLHFSTRTDDWDLAAAVRDAYETAKQLDGPLAILRKAPSFEEFAARYLHEDVGHLAETTRRARARELAPEGLLLGYFGRLPINEIDEVHIREWWGLEIEGRGRTTKTGRNYLNALSAVFGYARELRLIEVNPVVSFREILARKTRTQRGRAEAAPGRDIRPIDDPGEIDRLVEAAQAESPVAELLVLLCLDAGLRLGEALGLRWGHISWGQSESDPTRSLLICESRPQGGSPGPTKSGRERRVALSRRLRDALREWNRARFVPGLDVHVLPKFDPNNFRRRSWRRILERGGLGHRRIKDLRDTFASQLLTAGIQLGYVSRQLGHADVAVTARHYARWTGGDGYRCAMTVGPGEVPADLLARLGESLSQQPLTHRVRES